MPIGGKNKVWTVETLASILLPKPAAQTRLETLHAGENLYVTVELTNPKTTTAVQIQSEDYHVLGWAPRYLVHDLVHAIVNAPSVIKAKVVRFNPMPAPSKQRVLIELSGHLPEGYNPMEDDEYLSLSGSADQQV